MAIITLGNKKSSTFWCIGFFNWFWRTLKRWFQIWNQFFSISFSFLAIWDRWNSLNNMNLRNPNLSVLRLYTYLLLHFSTDFNKLGLKWKNKSIAKISRAGILNLNLVFLKLDFEISKMMSCNKLCWKFIKNLSPPSFLNRFRWKRS